MKKTLFSALILFAIITFTASVMAAPYGGETAASAVVAPLENGPPAENAEARPQKKTVVAVMPVIDNTKNQKYKEETIGVIRDFLSQKVSADTYQLVAKDSLTRAVAAAKVADWAVADKGDFRKLCLASGADFVIQLEAQAVYQKSGSHGFSVFTSMFHDVNVPIYVKIYDFAADKYLVNRLFPFQERYGGGWGGASSRSAMKDATQKAVREIGDVVAIPATVEKKGE